MFRKATNVVQKKFRNLAAIVTLVRILQILVSIWSPRISKLEEIIVQVLAIDLVIGDRST